MAIAIKDFWRLAVESRLITPDQGKALAQKYRGMRGGDIDDAKTLGVWLVSENAISRYQLRVLLAGRPGPFQYGDYQIYDRIGEGRLSGTFRALHVPSRHPVLLAFLSPDDVASGKRWAAIAAQTLAWSRTSHPNLCRVYEPVDLGTHKMVVLEDLRGESLAAMLQSGSREHAEAASWTQQVAWALSHAHQAGLPHGDVRPATLWLDPSGAIKLFVDPREPPTAPRVKQPDASGRLLERADYFAPEFASGLKAPDARTDIYALGATCYQLLSGRAPFPGGDVAQKLRRHANEAVDPLPGDVPQALGQLVNYMMAKNPEVRYQTAEDVGEQLRPFVNSTPPTPAAPATLPSFLEHIQRKQAELAAAQDAARRATVVVDDFEESSPGAPAVSPGGASRSRTRRPQRRDKTAWVVGGLCAAAAAILAVIVIVNSGNDDRDRDQQTASSADASDLTNVSAPSESGAAGTDSSTASSGGAATDGGPADAAETAGANVQLVDDDGETLWQSPTTGGPLALDYAPPAGMAYLTARPASLLQSENGRLALEALGPAFAAKVAEWEARAGLTLADVDSVLLTLHEAGDRLPRPSYVVRLTKPRAKSELVAAWQAAAVDDKAYWRAGDDCFYVPSTQADDSVGVFTMGAEQDIQEVAQRGGVPPLIRKGFADLLQLSDNQRHFNILFSPYDASNRFFHDTRSFYFGSGRKLRQPLEWFLGGELKAVAASMHVDDQLTYLELRFANSLDVNSLEIAKRTRERIADVQGRLEDYMATITPPEYWRKFAFRFPSMFRLVHRQSRVQVDQGLAMLNAALPPAAAHNLLFGGEMALASKPGAGPAVAQTPQVKPPQDVKELLQRKMSLSFDQLSLEFAVQQVEKDAKDNHQPPFDFEIDIVGPDLQLSGITRNQQIKDFAVRDQSIAEILTALVIKANPEAAPSPAADEQKLVWVVAPNKAKILVTTRPQSIKKEYELPAPFRPPEAAAAE